MPNVASKYRLLAEQCKGLGSQAKDEQYRLLLIRVAAILNELADQAEVGKNAAQKSQQRKKKPEQAIDREHHLAAQIASTMEQMQADVARAKASEDKKKTVTDPKRRDTDK